MINKEFQNNWIKILNFNKNREILNDPEKSNEVVRIPLTPININANLLYHFFEILYPRFINDQNNILDVILADTGKKNKVIRLYLYKTSKAGIHTSLETLQEDAIKIKSLEIENIEEIFNKVQSRVLKEKKIRISSLRIFKKEALELINNHCKEITKISLYEFFNSFSSLIQNLIQEELILIYPEPIIVTFLKKSLNLLDKIPLRSLFQLFYEILPEFRISLFLRGNFTNLVVVLQKKNSKSGVSDLTLKFLSLGDLEIDYKNTNLDQILITIQQKLKTEKIFLFNQKDLVSLLSDVFELIILFKRDNIKLLLQKALYGYRSFEKHWNVVPKSPFYKTLVRFFIRILGFNLNLRKLSHWAVPEIIFNYLDFFIGLNSKVLIIIKDTKKDKESKFQDKISKTEVKHSILIEIEQSAIKKISIVKLDEIFINSNSVSIDSVKNDLSIKYGFLSTVIVINKLLIQMIIQNFIIRGSKLSIIPQIKILKLLKKKMYLTIYPEFPPYKLLRNKRSRSLLKYILPIMIDKHEF
ncbi:MAG: hypothetical protein ACFFEY_01085 [Candidatus Thorarchaeota archaeon]